MRRCTGLILVLTLFCTACGTSGRLAPTAAVKSDDDAYFVIGSTGGTREIDGRTGEMWMAISDATTEAGVASFKIDPFGGLVPFLNWTEGGFAVGKAHHGGDTLAIWEAGGRYSPCGTGKLIVFKAPPGKVVYIVTLNAQATGSSDVMRFSYTQDIEPARAFLKTHYPNLADKLEMGSYELMSCEGGDPFP